MKIIWECCSIGKCLGALLNVTVTTFSSFQCRYHLGINLDWGLQKLPQKSVFFLHFKSCYIKDISILASRRPHHTSGKQGGFFLQEEIKKTQQQGITMNESLNKLGLKRYIYNRSYLEIIGDMKFWSVLGPSPCKQLYIKMMSQKCSLHIICVTIYGTFSELHFMEKVPKSMKIWDTSFPTS